MQTSYFLVFTPTDVSSPVFVLYPILGPPLHLLYTSVFIVFFITEEDITLLSNAGLAGERDLLVSVFQREDVMTLHCLIGCIQTHRKGVRAGRLWLYTFQKWSCVSAEAGGVHAHIAACHSQQHSSLASAAETAARTGYLFSHCCPSALPFSGSFILLKFYSTDWFRNQCKASRWHWSERHSRELQALQITVLS